MPKPGSHVPVPTGSLVAPVPKPQTRIPVPKPQTRVSVPASPPVSPSRSHAPVFLCRLVSQLFLPLSCRSQEAASPVTLRAPGMRGSAAFRASRDAGANAILQDIARARENIQKSLAGSTCSGSAGDKELILRIKTLELENKSLNGVVEDLRASLSKLECRVRVLEKSTASVAPARTPSVPYANGTTIHQSSGPVEQVNEDDDVDLFGSGEDDEEAEKLKEQRLKDYAEKKAKKMNYIAKSSLLLDVKPWDDETDMVKLEECVRSVQADGLLWGMSKLIPVGYGIKKLQISCVVEDDKVGTDMLEEEITKFEDYVQSVDVAAFNKI
ncbi:eukaryotic translation elongation factor 1 delta b (guanine nucleotide exchange protein) isoform X1 [Stigmatopora argus]